MSTASQKGQSRHRPCKQLCLQYHDEAIRLYYERRLSYGRIGKELGFSRSTIAEWISNFAATNPEIHAQMKKGAGPTPEDYAELQAEVARLQKALNADHMRAEFYDTMIDVAEEIFKFPYEKSWPKQEGRNNKRDTCEKELSTVRYFLNAGATNPSDKFDTTPAHSRHFTR